MKFILTLFIALLAIDISAQVPEVLWVNEGKNQEIVNPIVSPDGNYAAYVDGTTDNSIIVVDLADPSNRWQYKPSSGRIVEYSIAFASESVIYASTTSPFSLVRYDISNNSFTTREIDKYIERIVPMEDSLLALSYTGQQHPMLGIFDYENSNIVAEHKFIRYQPPSYIQSEKRLYLADTLSYTANDFVYRWVDFESPDLISRSPRSFKVNPSVFVPIGDNMLLLGRGTVDTTINQVVGTFSMTEITMLNENREIATQTSFLEEYHFLGIRDENSIYISNWFTSMNYIYDIQKGEIVDSTERKGGDFLHQNNEGIYTYNYGHISRYNSSYDRQERVFLGEEGKAYDDIRALVVDPGNTLISGDATGALQVWNPNDGRFFETTQRLSSAIQMLKVSNQKKYLALTTQDSLFIVKEGDLVDTLPLEVGIEMAFSDDDQYLAVGGFNGRIIVYDLENLDIINEFDGGNWIRGLDFYKDDQLIVASRSKYTLINIFDGIESEAPTMFDNEDTYKVNDISVSPDGRFTVVSAGQGHIYIFEDGKNYRRIETSYYMDGFTMASKIIWAPSEYGYSFMILGYSYLGAYDVINNNMLYFTNQLDGYDKGSNERYMAATFSSDGESFYFATSTMSIGAIANPFTESNIEESDELAAEAYPNPTNGLTTIPSEHRGLPFQLIDITGRTLLRGESLGAEIDLSPFAPGRYTLLIQNNTNTTLDIIRY